MLVGPLDFQAASEYVIDPLALLRILPVPGFILGEFADLSLTVFVCSEE